MRQKSDFRQQERYASYADEVQEKINQLPEPQRRYFSSLASQTHNLFLVMFEQCLQLSDLVSDLCMEVAFARYEIQQTFQEMLTRSEGTTNSSTQSYPKSNRKKPNHSHRNGSKNPSTNS